MSVIHALSLQHCTSGRGSGEARATPRAGPPLAEQPLRVSTCRAHGRWRSGGFTSSTASMRKAAS